MYGHLPFLMFTFPVPNTSFRVRKRVILKLVIFADGESSGCLTEW